MRKLGTLSGGNLQKFIVGREIMLSPQLLFVAQPTWGVDIGAASAIRSRLVALRNQGMAILVISEELEELFELCDSIQVLHHGLAQPAARNAGHEARGDRPIHDRGSSLARESPSMSAWSPAFVPTLVRRERASLAATLLAPVIALVIAIALNLGLYILMGRDPVAVVYAMLFEPFLSWASFSEVLLKAGPLLLIAQGLAIGFRAKVFNIGAEGQFILGAIFASAIPVWFPQATGQWIW